MRLSLALVTAMSPETRCIMRSMDVLYGASGLMLIKLFKWRAVTLTL